MTCADQAGRSLRRMSQRLSSTEAEQLTRHVAQISAGNLPLAAGLRVAAEESSSARIAAALFDRRPAGSGPIAGCHPGGVARTAAIAHQRLDSSGGGDRATGQCPDGASRASASRPLAPCEHPCRARLPLVVLCLATVVLLFIATYVMGIFGQMFSEFQTQAALGHRVALLVSSHGNLVVGRWHRGHAPRRRRLPRVLWPARADPAGFDHTDFRSPLAAGRPSRNGRV